MKYLFLISSPLYAFLTNLLISEIFFSTPLTFVLRTVAVAQALASAISPIFVLTLLRINLFRGAHGWGEGQKGPLPKMCQTYPTMKKLGEVIPYLKKIQKIYESRLEPCCHPNFFTENQQILLCQEIQI